MVPAKFPDYYAMIGLDPSATQEVIKTRWLDLVKMWHPDRNPGNEAALHNTKIVNQIYDVLKDPAKRAAYNEARRQALAPPPPAPPLMGREIYFGNGWVYTTTGGSGSTVTFSVGGWTFSMDGF